MNHPSNIWLITEDEFDHFTYTGGKVIYIVEEPKSMFVNHPATTTAGILLPPINAVNAELDGFLEQSYAMYSQYLDQTEAAIYVNIILAAALLGSPVGIMFGKDESELQFPKMFINYLYQRYGLVIGIMNKIQPYILESYMPLVLAVLLNSDMIDYPTFMMMHPAELPICPVAMNKLIREQNPALAKGETYEEYFNRMKNEMHRRGRFLIDPFIAI